MADFTKFGVDVGRYNSTLPTLSNGDAQELQLDDRGRLIVATDIDLDVNLSHTEDSIQIGDGTDLLAVNADGSLNVTINNSSVSIDDGGGAITVDGTVAATQSGAWTVTVQEPLSIDDNGGSISIDDGGNVITVDGTIAATQSGSWTVGISGISDGTDSLDINADGSINAVVTATDLDIRDLTHASDSVKIGDGTDFLAVNADGSINVQVDSSGGTEADEGSDESGDGIIAINNSAFTDVVSIAVGAGTTYFLQAVDFFADKQSQWRIAVYDDTTLTKIIRLGIVSSAMPGYGNSYPRAIEVAGGINITIRLQGKSQVASANAAGGLNGYTL